MQIETFECPETAIESPEETAEAVSLMENLGMSAQLKQVKDTTRFPFREMTADEKIVYETICPTAKPIAEYEQAPVPLRVLKCIELCATFPDAFTYIEIWDKVSAEVKDPVAVAVKRGENSWNKTYYLLARWGDELEPYTVLLEQVRETLAKQMRSHLQKIADLAISAASRVDDLPLAKLNSLPSDYDLGNL